MPPTPLSLPRTLALAVVREVTTQETKAMLNGQRFGGARAEKACFLCQKSPKSSAIELVLIAETKRRRRMSAEETSWTKSKMFNAELNGDTKKASRLGGLF